MLRSTDQAALTVQLDRLRGQVHWTACSIALAPYECEQLIERLGAMRARCRRLRRVMIEMHLTNCLSDETLDDAARRDQLDELVTMFDRFRT